MVQMLLGLRFRWPLVCPQPPIRVRGFTEPLHCFHFPNDLNLNCSSKYRNNPSCNRTSVRSKSNKVVTNETGFSALQEDCPWETGNLWSTFAFYIFSLHIPLSFGGLSAIAQIIGQPKLDPQTQVRFFFNFVDQNQIKRQLLLFSLIVGTWK